jgi:hypothetical protein
MGRFESGMFRDGTFCMCIENANVQYLQVKVLAAVYSMEVLAAILKSPSYTWRSQTTTYEG